MTQFYVKNEDGSFSPAASVQPTAPTDISVRLRRLVETLPVPESCANAMRTAADECERFYGGMIAWKETAQVKDRTIIDLRAQLDAMRPDSGRDAALVAVPAGWAMVPTDHSVAPKVFSKMVLGAMKVFSNKGYSPAKWEGNHTALVRGIIAAALEHQSKFPESYASEIAAHPAASVAQGEGPPDTAQGNWPHDFQQVIEGAEKTAHELGHAAGIEEAAKICESQVFSDGDTRAKAVAKGCAAAIRTLNENGGAV